MSADFNRLREIFLAAVEQHTPEQWDVYLDQACAGDAELRRQAAMLLKAHQEGRNPLDPGACGEEQTGPYRPLAERPGTVIGPYKLMEQIGEGGMGLVFVAEQQQPVRRRVALKVIKPGMDTREVIARFEAERQALALMDHPNIAKVHDGGATPSGRPYFVMELVKGVPITQYCDDNRLTPRQRLELFVSVCQAVQHAHQKGIIHRDVKPSNVLVSSHDGTPVVKVIDFGVAKAVGQHLTDKTVYTGFSQMVGTPLYMSPEQAGMSGLDIDTRTDIYALGVLLYELLTGTTPFDSERLRKASYEEIRRIIREEEPVKPSTRISTLGQAGATVSANRQSDPKRLKKLFRGELDWIVMKALEKDRNRRYETANGFAMDVQRYLADEPVQACPPSMGYRFRKFARRNKVALAFAGLVVLILMTLTGGIGWNLREQAVRQTAVEQEAGLALKDAERLQGERNWPEALEAAKRAEGVLAGSGSEVLRERIHQLRKDLEMVLRLEEIPLQMDWTEDGRQDDESVRRAYAAAFADYGLDVLGLPCEEAAAYIRARTGIAVALIAALDKWAGFQSDAKSREMLWDVAHAADSDPWLRQVREARRRKDSKRLAQLAVSPDLLRQPPTTQQSICVILRDYGEREAGIEVLRRAQRQYPGHFWLNYDLAYELRHAKPPRLDEAIAFYRAALAHRPRSSSLHNSLGLALKEHGRLDEAEACFRRAIELDPTSRTSWAAHFNLGRVLDKQGKQSEANAAHQKAIELIQKAIELRPNVASNHVYLGEAFRMQEKWEDAVASFRNGIGLGENTRRTWSQLGFCLRQLKRWPEAVTANEKALELAPEDLTARYNLGLNLHDLKRWDEALAAFQKTIDIDPKHARAHSRLGETLRAQRKLAQALAACQRAIDLDPNDANIWNCMGVILHDQEKWDEAAAAYQKAIERDPKHVEAYNNLGLALHDQKKLDEAIAAYQKAIEINPKCARAHNSLGIVLSDQQKLDEAVAAYRKAIEIDPQYAKAHNSLGLAFAAQGKLPEAIAAYRKAIEIDPTDRAPHLNLGNVLSKQRHLPEAIAVYQKAISIDPNYALAYANLGSARRDEGNLPEAVACYQKAIEIDPQYAKAHSSLGGVLERQGKQAEAETAYRMALKIDPNLGSARANLTRLLHNRAWALVTHSDPAKRDPDRALKLAKEAVELTPTNAWSWNTLGGAHYRAGNWNEALAALRRHRELRADDQEWAHPFFLAMTHWQLGNKDEARKWYDQGVEWMDKYQPKNEPLRRVKTEAGALLGLDKKD